MKPDTFTFFLGCCTGGVVTALLLLWWFLCVKHSAGMDARRKILSAYRAGYGHGVDLKPFAPPALEP